MTIAADLSNFAFSAAGVNTGGFTMRNKIINGAMVIDQRNGGASVSETGSSQYTLDRWQVAGSPAGAFSVQQVADAPTGFYNSLKITVATAVASPATDTSYQLHQRIEGYNCVDLGWGAAGAKNIILSFWVKSSVTGTMGGVVTNSAYDRTYPYTYTINTANTWEYKTVTIPGDTTGTWLKTNGIGVMLVFGFGAGSGRSAAANIWANTIARIPTGTTQLIATNAATWQISGVQLEVGSSATPFEYRNHQQELAMCQRYYQGTANVLAINSNQYQTIYFKCTMRAVPTMSYSGAGSFINNNVGVEAAYTYNATTTSFTYTASAEL